MPGNGKISTKKTEFISYSHGLWMFYLLQTRKSQFPNSVTGKAPSLSCGRCWATASFHWFSSTGQTLTQENIYFYPTIHEMHLILFVSLNPPYIPTCPHQVLQEQWTIQLRADTIHQCPPSLGTATSFSNTGESCDLLTRPRGAMSFVLRNPWRLK